MLPNVQLMHQDSLRRLKKKLLHIDIQANLRTPAAYSEMAANSRVTEEVARCHVLAGEYSLALKKGVTYLKGDFKKHLRY